MVTNKEGVITRLEQVTARWLTSTLIRSAALENGSVASFTVDSGRGNWSSSARLVLRYAPGSSGELPERLFLKMVDTDLDGEFFGPSEVTYYTRDYVGLADAPLLRCYHAAYSEEIHRYHLLLDDVSETHVQACEREPSLEYGQALAEGLAALHARWWGAAPLAEIEAPVHDAAHIRRFVEIAEPGVAPILEQFAVSLAPGWPALLRVLFARHPQALVARLQNEQGFTLVHGDVGCNNILVPRRGVRPLYLIDRQPFDWSLTTWLGVYDLAYAMVLDWEVDACRRLEQPVLHRYHAALLERGVSGYTWQRLWDDYRLCAAMGVYIAVEYCRGGINERYTHVWLPMLQRALAACEDLGIAGLW